MNNRNDLLSNEWYNLEDICGVKVGEKVYYAQCFPTQGTYEVLELNVARMKTNNIESYFVGTESRYKHSYLFSPKDLGRIVFKDRSECLKLVKSIEQLHKDEIVSNEIYYEED